MSHPLFDWRIRDIEREIELCKSRLYRVDTFGCDVDSLERSVRQISSDISELRAQLTTLQDSIKATK